MVMHPGTCDWGDCDKPAVGLRWDEFQPGWLPVCGVHWGEATSGDEVQPFDRDAIAPLLAAARAVVSEAEADIAYEGEGFVDCLVPFEAVDALRAALAALPEEPTR